MTNPPESKPSAGDAKKPLSTGKRWLIRIGIALAVVLVGLIIAAPWIASSDMVRDYAVASLNETLEGKFHVDRISTSWFGPTEVWGFSVKDPDGREVMSAEHAKVSKGLFGLARSWQSLGEGEVKNARLTLQVAPDGSLGFVRAFSAREAGEPSKAPYPAMRLKAALSGVSVKIILADNAAYELRDIRGSAEMDTLGRYKADLTALADGGGKLHLTADVRDLLKKKEFVLFESKADVKVTTEEPVEAGAVFAMLGVPGTQGKIRIDQFEAKMASRSADIRINVAVSQLRPTRSDVPAHPIDFNLTGILSGNIGEPTGLVAGTVKLSGAPGDFSARVIYRRTPVPLDFSAAGFAQAFVSGDTRALPDVLVEADGYLDLGAIGQAAPAFLGLESDVTLTSGRLDVRKLRFFTRDKISADGGAVEPPSADGAVEFKDLVATKAGQPVRIDPATLVFGMKILPDKGLEIERAELTSPLASVTARGRLTEFAAKFSFDLNRAYSQVRQVFNLGDFVLDGSVSGDLVVARPADGELHVNRLTVDARKFIFRRGDRKLGIDAAALSAKGIIRIENNRPARWEITESAFDLDCATVGRVTGWTEPASGGFHADVKLDRADFGGVVGKLKGLKFDVSQLARWGARVEVPSLAVDRRDDHSPITSTGALTAGNLMLDGAPLGVSEATLQWKDAWLGAGFDNLAVPTISLKSSILTAGASDLTLAWGKEFTAGGSARVMAQLGAVLPIVSRVTKSKAVPSVSGSLDWTAQEMRFGPEGLALKSHGTIDDVVLRVGDRTEKAQKMQFSESARIAFKNGLWSRYELDCATFDAPGRLVGSASGWMESAGPFDAKADFSTADLAFADAWLKAFDMNSLAGYSGLLSVNARASRGADGRILSDGTAMAKNVRVEGRPLGIELIKLTWAGADLAAGYDAISLKSGGIESPAARASGTGFSAKWGKEFSFSGELSVEADAGEALAALRALTNKDVPGVTGHVKWSGSAKAEPRRADGISAFTLAGDGELRDVKLRVGGAPRDVGTGKFSEAARLEFKGKDPFSVSVGKATLQFPGRFVGSATASYSFATGGFDSTLDVEQADLATAGDWASAFGVAQLKHYGGTAKVNATASCKSGRDPILSSGKAAVTGIRIDGKPLPSVPDASVEWTGASLNLTAESKDFAAEQVIFLSVPISVKATDLAGSLGGVARAKGAVKMTADLATSQAALTQLFGVTGLQPFSGLLTYTGTVVSDEKLTTLDGKTTIAKFRIGTGATAFADPLITITTTAAFDPAKSTARLDAFSLTSTPVTMTAKGTIHNYKTDRSIDLVGEYSGEWDKILPVACQFYPNLRGLVSLTGRTGGGFTLKGSLNSLSTTAPFLRPGLEGSAQVAWATADLTVLDYTFRFGPATLAATLKDGKVTLPPTPVATVPPENGKLRLAGTLDLSQPTPVLRIAGNQPLVENLKIDREFSAKMLNRFNPVFSGDAEGRVSVSVQDLVLPIGEGEAAKTMSGAGRVDLTQLRVNQKGFLGELLRLLDLMPEGNVDLPPTGANFTFANGRVYYRDFRIQANEKTDMIFSGSVGLFDDKIDLVVSLPGGPDILRRIGVPKAVADAAGEGRIELPIKGTRSAPRLDLADFIKRMTLGRIGNLFK